MDDQEENQEEDTLPEENSPEETVQVENLPENLPPPQLQPSIPPTLTVQGDPPTLRVEEVEAQTGEDAEDMVITDMDNRILDGDAQTSPGDETPATQLSGNMARVSMDSPSARLREEDPTEQRD